MSDYNLGTARGRIEVDTGGVSRNVAKAGKDVDNFTGKLAKSGGGMVKAGAVIGSVGVSIGAGFALAVNSAMDYEHRLAAIQAVSGATAGEMEMLSKKALALGKDTKFSASEAATAIEELVKAGVSVPDVMNGAADATVALAAAGEIDLPQAATIAANAMNGFGLSAKEMPKIADLIAGAANASAIDVSEFGMAMSQASAVANLAGWEFKDLSVAIAEMGNAGIKGSDAGTSLKSFLSNLIPTTEQQINLFEQLGFSTVGNAKAMAKLTEMGIKPATKSYNDVQAAMAKYIEASGGAKAGSAKNNKAVLALGSSTGALKNQFFDATGKAKSLKDMQKLLADGTKGMSKEQKLAAFNVLFGSDAIRAASVMAAAGSAGYDKMSTSMGKVTAAEVAATRQASLSGKWENLKGSAETIAITIGMQLVPALKALTERLTEALNWFLNLDEGTRNTILIIVGIIAAISLVVGGILVFAGAIGMLMSALAPLALVIGTTSAVLLGWIAVIAAVVAAVVIIGVLIWRNWDAIKAKTIEIWNAVKDWIVQTWNAIYASVSGALASVWAVISSVMNSIAAFFSMVWNGIKDAISFVFNLIVTIITTYINIWLAIITTVLNVIKSVWSSIWGLFGPLVMAVFGLIKAVISLAMAAIMFVVRSVMLGIQIVWTAIWNGIKTVAGTVWGAISKVITIAVNAIKSVVTTVFNAVKNVVTTIWNGIKSVTSTVWNAVKAAVSGPINAVLSVVSSVVGRVKSAVSTAWGVVKSITSSIWNSLKTIVSTAITNFMSNVTGIKDKVLGAFSGAGTWLLNAGKKVVQGLIDGVTGMIRTLTDKLSFITNLIPKHKGPPAKDKVLLKSAGQMIIQGLIDGMDDKVGGVVDTAKGVAGSIINTMNRVLEIASPSKAMQKIGAFVGSGLIVGLVGTKTAVVNASKQLATQLAAVFSERIKNKDNGVILQLRNEIASLMPLVAKHKEVAVRLAAAKKQLASAMALKGDAASLGLSAATAVMVGLRKQNDALTKIAISREVVAAKMDAARVKLEDAIKIRDDFSKQVADSAGAADITATTAVGDNKVTPNDVVNQLKERLVVLQKFAANMAGLQAMGINKTAYKQLLDAGIEAGSATAAALISGGKSVVESINLLQKGIEIQAKALGQESAKILYQAGVDTAAGMVRGLASQSKALASAATSLARTLVAAVKKALGIKSPSKVMEDQGVYTALGLIRGIESQRNKVAAAMKSLVMVPAINIPDVSSALSKSAYGFSASRYSQPDSQTSSKSVIINNNTYNPIAEKASLSTNRNLQRLATMGAFA